MKSSNRRKLVISLALSVTAGLMVTGGLSFQRKLATFQSGGLVLRAGPTAGVWIGSVDLALHPALRTGDQLVLVDGEIPASTSEALELLRARESAELVVMRGTEAVTIPFSRPPLDVDYSYLVLAFIGAIYLLIGLYTILREQSRQATLFFLWCLSSSAFYILTSTPFSLLTVDATGRALYVVEEAFRLLIGPLTLHFFLTFPRDLANGPTRRRLTPGLYLPAAFLALLQYDLIFASGRLLLGGPRAEVMGGLVQQLDRVELYLFVAYAVAAAGLLLYRMAAPGRHDQ